MTESILQQLRRPFHPSAISWKPGALTGDKTKCMAMAYADLRAYQNRLDELCGLGWAVSYVTWGERIICQVTISGVTRSSTGESDTDSEIGGTSAEAQAFKRACAMFGLGRYLYELPSVWVEFDASKRSMTEAAKTQLAGRYATWYAKAITKFAAQPDSEAPTE
jgi:hypothetical protein